MEYEDRVVIFLDVLGFSNFTNYTGATHMTELDIDAFRGFISQYDSEEFETKAP